MIELARRCCLSHYCPRRREHAPWPASPPPPRGERQQRSPPHEVLADKLPNAPNRIEPALILGRMAAGALRRRAGRSSHGNESARRRGRGRGHRVREHTCDVPRATRIDGTNACHQRGIDRGRDGRGRCGGGPHASAARSVRPGEGLELHQHGRARTNADRRKFIPERGVSAPWPARGRSSARPRFQRSARATTPRATSVARRYTTVWSSEER